MLMVSTCDESTQFWVGCESSGRMFGRIFCGGRELELRAACLGAHVQGCISGGAELTGGLGRFDRTVLAGVASGGLLAP